jgi:hypothetical protein
VATDPRRDRQKPALKATQAKSCDACQLPSSVETVPADLRRADQDMRLGQFLRALTPMAQQDKISILGPRDDGTYVIEFRTVAGERLAISVPSDKASLLKHFQAGERRSGLQRTRFSGTRRDVAKEANASERNPS